MKDDPSLENLKAECQQHALALSSFYCAQDALEELVRRGSLPRFIFRNRQADEVIRAALHHTAVVAYARPFTDSNTANGRFVYRKNCIKKATHFDSGIHGMLIEIRNKLVAHLDQRELGPEVITAFETFPGGTREVREVATSFGTLLETRDRAFERKLLQHVSSVAEHVQSLLFEKLEQYFDLSQDDPDFAYAQGKLAAWDELPLAEHGGQILPSISDHEVSDLSWPAILGANKNSFSFRRLVFSVSAQREGKARRIRTEIVNLS